MKYHLPKFVHHYENKDLTSCALFQEFIVAPIVPVEDGYDLRGLTCRCRGAMMLMFTESSKLYRCIEDNSRRLRVRRRLRCIQWTRD